MKKKIFFMLALLCAVAQGTWAQITFPIVYDDVWDGRTTSVPVYYTEYKGHTNVVVIKKASELAYIRDNWREKATYSENTNPYSNLNYYLDANLDLGDAVSWNSIGKGWLDGLTKTFYGANHTIRINIQHEGEEDAGGGLFSRLGAKGVIQDLHVTGIINVGDWRCIGAIVGENLGKIKNCWVSADVISAHYSASNSAALGGIAGQCYGSSSVEYCCMTGNVSNPKNNGVAGIIGEGYGNANHVTFYGTRYNDHSEHDIWVGDQDGTLTNQHADDLNNDATLTSYLGSFSGNDLYRQAIQYSYAVNIKNIGTGIMTSNLERTRPGQTVRLTKASGNSVASVTVKDADSNPITVSGNEMNGWTFTMPQRDVTVTAAFLNDDGTVPDTGMSIDVWNGSSQARPGYFDASSHTIHIQSAAQLIYVYNNWDNEVFSGYDYYECNYILDTDLDMSTKTWKPLGSKAYKGTFNGNGHMIRIKIDDSSISDNGQGLFATIASGSRVENLHVDGKIKVGNARLVGGIAGENNGTISNCWVSGNVSSDWKNSSVAATAKVGGIAGENNGTLEYCCMSGNVTNDDADVGGLVGCNDGTLQHCTFYGERSSTHDQASIYSGNSANWEYCYGVFNQDEYNAASGKDMYRHAIRYTYDVTVNIGGRGTVRTRALDEDDVPGTCAGQTFSLNVTSGTALNVTVTDADGNNVPLQGHANDNSSFWFVMPSKNVTATVTFGYTDWPTQGAGTVDDPYIISSAEDWNDFAYNVRIGRSYSGQYVKLTSDISVSTMAGAYQADDNCQPFSGTFDGDGHTLTINLNNQSRFAAPFKCVSGAIIKNLRTAGTINGTGNADGKLLAGLVGISFGSTTITNCRSSVTLTTDFGEDAAMAGCVAGTKGGSLTISGCVFDGSMTGSTNTRCAGIAGFEYEATTTTITNTLFAPATLTVSTTDDTYTKTFTRDADATITDCYYTRVLGTAQGTQAMRTATAPSAIGSEVQDYGMVTAYENGLLFGGKYYYATATSVGCFTEASPHIISSTDDWNDFVHNVGIGYNYSGQYVQLAADISVTTMAGNSFSGTFDGGDHTITANISGTGSKALFNRIDGGTIQNLKLAGNVSGGIHTAALVVSLGNSGANLIQNCVVSANVTCSSSHMGGFLAHGNTSNITINCCVFSGKMTGGSSAKGVFYGWGDASGTSRVTNCLYLMADGQDLTGLDLVHLNGATTLVDRCYKNTATGSYGTQATVSTEAPGCSGNLMYDCSIVKAYQGAILYGGNYYYDARGITSTSTTLSTGTYTVYTDITIPSRITISGNVTLNLGEGATLHAPKGIDLSYGNSLTINGPGTMTIDNCDDNMAGIGSSSMGSLTINSGVVNVKGGYSGAGIGGNRRGNGGYVIIHGGVVNAMGGQGGPGIGGGADFSIKDSQNHPCGDVVITGGQVTAIGNKVYGIGPGAAHVGEYHNGTLQLSWTNPDDFVFISTAVSYTQRTLSSITFENGKQFYLEHTTAIATESNLYGYKLLPYTGTLPSLAGTGTAEDPYLINNHDDWLLFYRYVNSGTNSYSGQHVKLMTDLTITTTVGFRDDKPFSGTFLGNGHTLTANLTGTIHGLDVNNEQGTAPFHYIKNATIKNLTITGDTYSTSLHAGGLVGFADGTNLIEGCIVTSTLHLSNKYAGGIIAHGLNSTTTLRDCVFAGTITSYYENQLYNGENVIEIGGIWGWSDDGATPTLQNCLEKGSFNNIKSMHPIGLQGGSGTITNCYYLNPQVGSPRNACTVSGAKQAYTAATAPANLGNLVQNYGMVKAYANGILFDGKYYVAPASISLANAADNSTTITDADGYVANVTLAARTLYKDGAWNTICLPFNVTLDSSPLAGATARTLTEASISGSTLTLTFGDAVTTLEAGTPYIIKWAKADGYDEASEETRDLKNPVFSGVTIDSDMHPYDTAEESVTTDERVRFVGTYKSTAFNADDKSILLMGSENTLYYPTAGAGIGAQRAYFKIGGDGALLARRLTAFNIDFGDDETTGIISTTNYTNDTNSDAWFTLDGRKLQGKPSRAGVYINNGIKVVIK